MLADRDLDGWLLWDFRGQNPTALDALGLAGCLLTRRLAYWIPGNDEPVLLVHAVEAGSLPALPGTRRTYSGYLELEQAVGDFLRGRRRIAMEYTPNGEIPYLSRVDAGTLEWIRSFGVEVVSSADLVQHFLCRLTDAQVESHIRAALAIDRAREEAFARIAEGIRRGSPESEYGIQQFLMHRFQSMGLTTDHAPVVAVDRHAGDPHYVPPPEGSAPCARDSLVLIDLWAKEHSPDAVYADVTWTAWTGPTPPDRVASVFDVVTAARDRGLAKIEQLSRLGGRFEGWQIDREVRDFITARGYGERFVHRTGHNIGTAAVHGDGAHLDDLETHDTRELVPGLCFSIEPGIYLEDFGIRSEINVVLEEDGPRVYTPVQRNLIRLGP